MFNPWKATPVVLLLASSALFACAASSAGESAEEPQSDTQDVISAEAFSTECTLSTASDGKTYKGAFNGHFKVTKDGSLSTNEQLAVTIDKAPDAKTFNYTLKVKSGKVVDAKNEIFEFDATELSKDVDVTVKYNGKTQKADLEFPIIIPRFKKTVSFDAHCDFKDAEGNLTTNVAAK